MLPFPALLAVLPLQITDAPQIDWQRNLDDALAIAEAQGRRILIAVNADGESASERIVRERYRDADFVAHTRSFVCVVGSVFRHTPRDFDAEGRRIPCPRLGAVTCGEHIALEPRAHERFLAGAEILLDGERVERISPRHALVAPDGGVDWDLFLLFDLGRLDQRLAESAAAAPPAVEWQPAFFEPLADDAAARREQLRAAAADRHNRGRTRFEQLIERAGSRRWEMTQAVLHAGDVGSIGSAGALRALLAQWRLPEGRLAFVARVLGIEAELAADARALLRARRAFPAPSPRWLLSALAQLDAESTRTLRLSHQVMPDERLFEILETAADTRAESASARPADERPSAAEYEAQLASLEGLRASRPDDAELSLQFGRALAGLARRRLEAGDSGAGFLLEDAARELGRAEESFPHDATLQLDLARVAFHRSDFEAQERHALRVLTQPGIDADLRTEAQRWLGDAGARLLARRAPGDAPGDAEEERAALLRTFEAFVAVALGIESDATDWESLASFCGATGRLFAQGEVAREGLERTPESDRLRQVFAASQYGLAAPARLREAYAELARKHPESGACAWYAGWAAVNQAEWLRRGEEPERALETYAAAETHFRRAGELRPDYADTCRHYLAMCALGRGFAHLLADRRSAAAGGLVAAIGLRPAVAAQRDGLDREALDLVDGALEWRWSSPSPVDPRALADQLAAVDSASAFWPRAIADAELREGLRAYGRSEPDQGLKHLRTSLEIARRALALEDDEENRALVAQSATVIAEALLDAGDAAEEVQGLLVEAAPLQGLEAPAADATTEQLRELRDRLRELLGSARPAFRPGR